jgi:hypothetical protein
VSGMTSRIEMAEALRSLADRLERQSETHQGSYADGMDDAAQIVRDEADKYDPQVS